MKPVSSKAIAALLTATLGLSAIAPAMAQQAPTAPTAQPDQAGFRPGQHGPRHAGGNDLLNFDRGAEAVEVALVRLGHRLDLTEAQRALLDTLKTDALAAAETLEAAASALRPAAEGETPASPSLSERLETRIALDTARLDALKSVQPALTAFFDSLTEEQKAGLMPQREEGHARFQGRDGGHGSGKQRPAGPAEPATPNNG